MACTRRRKRLVAMVFFPSSELLLDPSPPRVADTLPGQLAKSTARGALAARAANPAPFISRARAPGVAGLGLSIAWEAWNLFAGEPVPIPILGMNFPASVTTTSFTIQVTSTWKDKLVPPGVEFTDTSPVRTLQGTLLNVEIGTGDQGFVGVYATIRNADGTTRREAVSSFEGNSNRYEVLSLDNVDVVPQGSTDRSPATYPFTVPQQFLPSNPDIALDLAIPRIPGITPVPIIIPIIIPTPSDLARNPIPVVYPTSIPQEERQGLPQIWITPEGVQVGRGYADDRVVVTIGDATSSSTNINTQIDYDIRNPPTIVTCNADPDPPDNGCPCPDIREIVFEELDKKFPPKRPATLSEDSYPASNSNSITLPLHSLWVRLEIVEDVPNAKLISGGLSAPDVVYNGWYSFGATDFTSERIPFNYQSASIPVPAGCRQFSYTIYSLGTATVTVGYLVGA